MSTVKSDLNIAQMYASQLKNACQSLTAIAVASQDDLTTLRGNNKAHQCLTKSQNLASQVSAAVTLTSERLHSVASDFEALDEAGANSFRSNV
ncbi:MULTISPECIES: TIGR04197 family type VII secretion effector [Streptococcus]|uniref:Type VII secretion effector n=2 Tax=Streptococcus TaxID=1301 RepID=A0A4V0BUI7_9STRE|nr:MULTISPECIES: TIGR04197 family type VII secretion effector [Streptococcus]VTS72233.1 type VII secretion effector [Streptococcus australis]VTT10549.1 type VII secretion effector [Streptococcus oralis]